MKDQIVALMLGGLDKLNLYAGAIFGALALLNIVAPIAITCLFVILAAALLSVHYLDERKKKKAIATQANEKTDEQLEIEMNGGVSK